MSDLRFNLDLTKKKKEIIYKRHSCVSWGNLNIKSLLEDIMEYLFTFFVMVMVFQLCEGFVMLRKKYELFKG